MKTYSVFSFYNNVFKYRKNIETTINTFDTNYNLNPNKMKNLLLFVTLLFSLSLSAAEGDSCDNPITANIGENSATTENGNQWFVFTATTAGDYIVSNDEYLDESEMIMLKVYSDCDTEIDTLVDMGSSGSIIMVSLSTDESVILMWRDDYSKAAFTFNIHTAETGEAFAKPIVIDAPGTITFPSDKETLYYSYTVTDSAVVILSENDNDYYTTLYNDNGDEIAYGYMDERKYHLAPDTYIVKMKSYVDVSFDWTLTERDLILGEFCYAPIVLTESCEVDFGGNEERVYYSFTAQADGKICGANMSSSFVIVYDECDGNELYTHEISENFCYAVEAGINYIIYLTVGYGIDEFTWNFIVADGAGESCDNPIIINDYGTISTPVGSGLLYYKFISTNGGAFRISDGAEVETNNVKLFANCEQVGFGIGYELAEGYYGEILYEAEAGDEFIVIWNIGGGGITKGDDFFTWSLLADDTPGLSCDNPIILTETGDIQYQEGNQELYYSYTASRDCRLELTHGDSFSGTFCMFLDCEGEQADQQGYGGEMVVFAEEDVTYIFRWKPYSEPYNAFTWTINEEDYHGGETCKYPKVISEPGDIEFTQTEGSIYYSYTATMNGAIVVSDGDYENLINMIPDCDNLGEYEYSVIGELTIGGTLDETYIFKWENKETVAFTWTLTENEGVPGGTCGNPIIIESLGEQGTPVEFEVTATSGYTYYSFTPDNNQMMIITDNNKVNKIAVDSTCDFNTAAYGNTGELDTEILSGTNYIIRWESMSSSGFAFTADSRDVLPGETPNSAIVIDAPGEITFLDGRNELYYSYTATKDAAIEMISDNEDAYVNSGSLKYVEAGETLIIQWINPSETTFTWTLTERDIIDGETCSNPIVITSAGDVVCNIELKNIYYSYTPTQNSIIKVTDNDNNHYVYITKGCNYSSYYYNSDGEIAFEATTSENVIIRWNNNDMLEFIWNIIEETPQVGETANNPIVIEQPETINYIGIDKGLVRNYYSYTPTVKQQVNLSLVNFVMVYNAATGDTLSRVWYDSTTFVAQKNTKYIIAWELDGGSIETLTLTATELFDETSTITFNISDSYGALADATISINGTTISTNASGTANIELEDGTYDYTITATDYQDLAGQVVVNNANRTVTAVLLPIGVETSTITFNISDSNGAIADATININGTTLSTNTSGTANIELEDSTYNYTITATNYQEQSGQVTVNGEAIVITIELLPVGIRDIKQIAVNIYPNPTSERITIESNEPIERISLFTFDGKQVLLENNHSKSLNIGSLENGIYLLQLNFNRNIVTKRIIKK